MSKIFWWVILVFLFVCLIGLFYQHEKEFPSGGGNPHIAGFFEINNGGVR